MAEETLQSVADHYNEESDDDFDPSVAAAQPQEDSSDDEESAAITAQQRSQRHAPPQDEPLDFDNSGDESTIQSGKKRKRKKPDEDEDEGGEGGFVKTRAQRKAEGIERKPLVDAGRAQVDVNALWAEMSASAPAKAPQSEPVAASSDSVLKPAATSLAPLPQPATDSNTEQPDGAFVTIKRRYGFAGQTIQEERQVPASSAEARLFLQEQATASDPPKPTKPGVNRPKKRKTPFGGFSADLPPSDAAGKGKKLNTLEKSKLDWAAHVDKEGIGEELDEASRAKGSYLGKVDFLGRMSAKREDELRGKK